VILMMCYRFVFGSRRMWIRLCSAYGKVHVAVGLVGWALAPRWEAGCAFQEGWRRNC